MKCPINSFFILFIFFGSENMPNKSFIIFLSDSEIVTQQSFKNAASFDQHEQLEYHG